MFCNGIIFLSGLMILYLLKNDKDIFVTIALMTLLACFIFLVSFINFYKSLKNKILHDPKCY